MHFYLHRATPLHDWRVIDTPMIEGEVVELSDCHWYSEAQAEADRRNGKQDGGQEALPL